MHHFKVLAVKGNRNTLFVNPVAGMPGNLTQKDSQSINYLTVRSVRDIAGDMSTDKLLTHWCILYTGYHLALGKKRRRGNKSYMMEDLKIY